MDIYSRNMPHLCWHEGLDVTVDEAHGVELVGRHQRAPQLSAAVERLRLHLLLGHSVRHKLVNDHRHLQEGVGALQGAGITKDCIISH
jgi:hypothetical protein